MDLFSLTSDRVLRIKGCLQRRGNRVLKGVVAFGWPGGKPQVVQTVSLSRL